MAPVIANHFDQITPAVLLLAALYANPVVFNNMTYYWQASYQALPTATGERSREAITGVSARLSNEDENEWQEYPVANSGAA